MSATGLLIAVYCATFKSGRSSVGVANLGSLRTGLPPQGVEGTGKTSKARRGAPRIRGENGSRHARVNARAVPFHCPDSARQVMQLLDTYRWALGEHATISPHCRKLPLE